ncbi:hypothetical protein V8G54_013343 [Vigna mungo]|uniref:PSMD12/CSN4-like N-terminal domain-containing protein n=1 Tax=Vigna mungo TaxID=3915 RepID=A0AAQ3NVH5_VIGMU
MALAKTPNNQGLIKKLAKIKEDQGHIVEALDLMQEIGVETFGAMAKTEKITFILEQDFEKKTAMAGELSHELILEILSWLSVTSLIRFRPSPRLRLNFGIGVHHDMKFGFGYDDRRDSYKVVAMVGDWRTHQIWV